MKQFIKKIALLALLVTLAAMGLNFLGAKMGNVYKDGAALVCETKRHMIRNGEIEHPKGKVNVLFMGTSRILFGLNPTQFDRLTGGKTHSYNLALPALPIGSAYFLLKDYLHRNPPPQYIALQLFLSKFKNWKIFDYYINQGLGGMDEVVSLLNNLESKSFLINYLFPFRMDKYPTFKYLYNSLLKPSSVKKAHQSNMAILKRLKDDRGYYFTEEHALIPRNTGTKELTQEPQFDPFTDSYVKMFFDLAQKKGIKVLLIQAAYRIDEYLPYESIPLHFKKIRDHYPNVIIAPQGWKQKRYPHKYFSDDIHLNNEGALIYTRAIYDDFIAALPPAALRGASGGQGAAPPGPPLSLREW
jgi:hypothetical protein